MKYLQNTETKEIVPFTDAAFDALDSNTRKKGFREVAVLRLKHVADGRTALIAKSEFDKFGKAEKAEWDVETDPEVLARSILKDAITEGSTERESDADDDNKGGAADHGGEEQQEEEHGDAQ